MERARILTRNVQTFLTDARKAEGARPGRPVALHWPLQRYPPQLRRPRSLYARSRGAQGSRNKLLGIVFDYRTHAEVNELEAVDEVVATRVRNYHSIVAQYHGRCLFWTKQGFHSLTSPGVGGCGHAVVVPDGLSFPVVVWISTARIVGGSWDVRLLGV